MGVLSTTDNAVRLLAADDARLRLVVALREAGLEVSARVQVLPLTRTGVDALGAVLGLGHLDRP